MFGGNKVGEHKEGGERNLPGLGSVLQSDLAREETEAKKEEETRGTKPRYEAIDREQLCWRVVDVERLIGEEHPARAIWEFVGEARSERVQCRDPSGGRSSGTAGVGSAAIDQLMGVWVQRRSGVGASDRADVRVGGWISVADGSEGS